MKVQRSRPAESIPKRSDLTRLANVPYATMPIPPSILLPRVLETGCEMLPPIT